MLCNCLHREVNTKTCKLAKKTMPISFCGDCAWLTDGDEIKAKEDKERKKDIDEKRANSKEIRKTLGNRPQNKMGKPPEVKEVMLSEEHPDVIEGEEMSIVRYADKAKVFRHILWLPQLLHDPLREEADKQQRTSAEVLKDILRLHFGLRISKHHPNFKGGIYNEERSEASI